MIFEVTNKWLREKNACTSGYRWAQTQDNREFCAFVRSCAANRYDWAVWVITQRATKEQRVRFAVYCAELVLPFYEKRFPSDDRPREAIESAKEWLANQTHKNRVAASADAAAAAAAYAAADAAAVAAAAAAAYAAADAAAAAAYAAAAAAAYAAAYAAADAAAVAAAYAAADAAADASTKTKIVEYGITLFKDGAK